MNKNVILFKGRSYQYEDEKILLIPLSLISLASVIREFYNPIILNGDIKSEIQIFKDVEIYLHSVLCVGISALTGPEIASGLRFAAMVKETCPDIPIIWGGWHVSCLPKESIKNPYVDAIIVGLGQIIFPLVLDRINQGSRFDDLAGVVTIDNNNGQIKCNQPLRSFDLHDCPLPAFDMLDLEFYRRESLNFLHYPKINDVKITGYLYYVTSFGCPFSCAFCSNDLLFNQCWYGYSVDAVLDQLGWLIREYGFNSIAIIDAEFFHQIKRVEYFCDEIIKRDYKFVWDAQASVKSILRLQKKGLLPKLRQAGCWRMNIGAETGTEEMLKYINKKIHIKDTLECSHALKKANIVGTFNFLFGLPPETYFDLIESFSLAYHLKKVNPDSPLPISFYTPFPGTPIFDDALKYGFVAPKNLEEWANYKVSYANLANEIPWRRKEHEKLVYDVLTFYLPIAVPGNIRRGTITMYKRKIEKSPFRILFKLASMIADWRIKKMNFRFRIEKFLYDLYCGLFIRKYYKSANWTTNDD